MPDYYSEPFLNLAGLTHKSALIAWGAFYFRVKNNDSDFKLVDDDDLNHVYPPRHQTVGAIGNELKTRWVSGQKPGLIRIALERIPIRPNQPNLLPSPSSEILVSGS